VPSHFKRSLLKREAGQDALQLSTFQALDDKLVEQAVTTANDASMNEVIQVHLKTVLKLNGTWRLFDKTSCKITPCVFMWCLLFLHRALCAAILRVYYALNNRMRYGA
jgi:hypothetical protein